MKFTRGLQIACFVVKCRAFFSVNKVRHRREYKRFTFVVSSFFFSGWVSFKMLAAEIFQKFELISLNAFSWRFDSLAKFDLFIYWNSCWTRERMHWKSYLNDSRSSQMIFSRSLIFVEVWKTRKKMKHND